MKEAIPKIDLEKEDIDLENWKPVKRGKFKKYKTEYKYVIEHNKELPVDKRARLRITETKPIVHHLRTRYEPHIEVDGEQGFCSGLFWL